MSQRLITIPIVIIALFLSLFLLPLLQSPILGFNILTITLILVMLFGDTKLALFCGVLGGFLMDLVSALPFGTFMVSLTVSLIIIRQINQSWVTNRSLTAYTSLTVIGIVLFYVCLYGYGFVGTLFDTTAISPQLGRTAIISSLADVVRGCVIALMVYAMVRITGYSYATLARHEF
jgi:rod shape-determining protein MreD